jgi:signal peptidase I
MEPTLHCPRPAGGCRGDEADRIAVSRVLYRVLDPRRGDIVAYKIPAAGARQCGSEPGSIFVHRIVGLPGERWRTAGGFVYIDGKRLDEPYVKPDRRDLQRLPERRIPQGRYLVLGDSRPSSCDSRVWGYVPRKAFVGPKIATYWPLERISIR